MSFLFDFWTGVDKVRGVMVLPTGGICSLTYFKEFAQKQRTLCKWFEAKGAWFFAFPPWVMVGAEAEEKARVRRK